MIKKYPKIRKDKHGKPKEVYLDNDVYQSIFNEINEFEDKIAKLKNKPLTHSKKSQK